MLRDKFFALLVCVCVFLCNCLFGGGISCEYLELMVAFLDGDLLGGLDVRIWRTFVFASCKSKQARMRTANASVALHVASLRDLLRFISLRICWYRY